MPQIHAARRALINDLFWSGIGIALGKSFPLMMGIVLARILSPEMFGGITIALYSQSTVATLLFSGLQQVSNVLSAGARTANERAARIKHLVVLAFVSSTAIAVMLAVASPFLATTLIGHRDIGPPLALMLASLPFLSTLSVYQGAAAGAGNFFGTANIQLISGSLTAIGAVLGAAAGGMWMAATGYTLGSMLSALASYTLLYRQQGTPVNAVPAARHNISARNFFLDLMAPVTLAALLTAPALWYFSSTLARRGGLSEAGIFQIALSWHVLSCFVGTALYSVLLTRLTKAPSGSLPSLLARLLALSVILTLIVSIVVCVAAPYILSLYGPVMSTHTTVLRLMSLASVPVVAAGVLGQALASQRRMWLGAAWNLLWLCLFLVLCATLLPNPFSATDLARCFLLSYMAYSLILALWMFTRSHRWTRQSISNKDLLSQ